MIVIPCLEAEDRITLALDALLALLFKDSLWVNVDSQKACLLTKTLNLTLPKYTKENKGNFIMTQKRNLPEYLSSLENPGTFIESN